MSTKTIKRPSPKLKTSHPFSSASSKNVNFPKLSSLPSKTNAISIFLVSNPSSSEININSNGIHKPFILKLQIKSNKSNKCTRSIAKECRNLKRFKLQGLTENYSLQTTFPQQRVTFHPIQMNHRMKIILALSLTTEMILNQEDITKRTQSRKIFLVRFFWTGKKPTLRWRLMHLAALRWDKVQCCQVKIFLTSDKLFSDLIFSYFSCFLQHFLYQAFFCLLYFDIFL